ncbi:MAG: DUF4293 domain-containing protein [Bacteroidales bacterium]|nr:DUF4293 domain-containing protein [Bacteroidales bacterium]
MIQRIQSLYLFLAAVCSGLLFCFDLASFDYGATMMNLSVLGVDNQIDATYFGSSYTLPLLVMAVIMTILPVITLLMYNRRRRQVKLCQLDMLLNLSFAVLVMLYYISDIQKSINSDIVSFGIAIYIPLASLIFNLLAIRGIKKDIELLRSVDRIR